MKAFRFETTESFRRMPGRRFAAILQTFLFTGTGRKADHVVVIFRRIFRQTTVGSKQFILSIPKQSFLWIKPALTVPTP